jgi:hypothetical protein
MKKFLFFLSFLIIFFSCKKEASINLPDTPPKLSVSCFISDSVELIRATISWSNPVFSSSNKGNEPPSDLLVTISGNGITDTLLFDQEYFWYALPVSEFPLSPGVEYTLNVVAPTGEKVSAKTKIPELNPSISSASVSENASVDQYGNNIIDYTFRIVLNELNSEKEYYRLVFYSTAINPGIPGEFIYNDVRGEVYADDNNVISGKIFTEQYVQWYGVDSAQYSSFAHVIHASEAYYRFHKTLANYNQNNPFVEPTIAYSNVENGLGVFAGYRQVRVEF